MRNTGTLNKQDILTKCNEKNNLDTNTKDTKPVTHSITVRKSTRSRIALVEANTFPRK